MHEWREKHGESPPPPLKRRRLYRCMGGGLRPGLAGLPDLSLSYPRTAGGEGLQEGARREVVDLKAERIAEA